MNKQEVTQLKVIALQAAGPNQLDSAKLIFEWLAADTVQELAQKYAEEQIASANAKQIEDESAPF